MQTIYIPPAVAKVRRLARGSTRLVRPPPMDLDPDEEMRATPSYKLLDVDQLLKLEFNPAGLFYSTPKI